MIVSAGVSGSFSCSCTQACLHNADQITTSTVLIMNRIKNQKSALLASLREQSDEELDFDNVDTPTIKTRAPDDIFGLEENIETLKLSNLSKPPKPQFIRPSLSPGHLMKFQESDNDEEMSFAKDFDENDVFNERNIQAHPFLEKNSPGTASNVSPGQRRSISDYSEGTNLTSEMDEGDFEEIDDIFGKEESGIYSSGGRSNQANASRASQVLLEKKKQLQRKAEAEEAEMYERYNHQKRPEEPVVNSLKLRDMNHRNQNGQPGIDQDALENEKSVNYEYTKDDLEAFEDGFDLNGPLTFNKDKLLHFRSSTGTERQLLREMSMPNFPRSLKSMKPAKYKSTMDLAAVANDGHPFFNNRNNIIRKLNRMPSFHNPNAEVHNAPQQANNLQDSLDQDLELRKQMLLEKYMEITEKQKKLRTSPRKPRANDQEPVKAGPRKKPVGLVKFLNRDSVPATDSNGKMVYNAASKRWEGNEHDLMRFDDAFDPTHPRKQPSLIRKQDFLPKEGKIKKNMRYDPENLRWVNLDKSDEENIFDDLPDLEPNDLPQYHTPEPPANRGVSTFTQRTTLTTSSDRSSAVGRNNNVGQEFHLQPKLINRFEKEEARMKRKMHHWFAPHEHYKVDVPKNFTGDYFWEIRKMVVEE